MTLVRREIHRFFRDGFLTLSQRHVVQILRGEHETKLLAELFYILRVIVVSFTVNSLTSLLKLQSMAENLYFQRIDSWGENEKYRRGRGRLFVRFFEWLHTELYEFLT